MNTQKQVIVVFGLDKNDRPRAATFDPEDAEVAARAAALMGLSVGRAESRLAIVMARENLPAGKIFRSGKALVPLVKWGLYEKLCRVLTPLTVPARASPKR